MNKDEYQQMLQGRVSVGAEHHDPINPQPQKVKQDISQVHPGSLVKQFNVTTPADQRFPQEAQLVGVDKAKELAMQQLQSFGINSGKEPSIHIPSGQYSLEDLVDSASLRNEHPHVVYSRLKTLRADQVAQRKASKDVEARERYQKYIELLNSELAKIEKVHPQVGNFTPSDKSPLANVHSSVKKPPTEQDAEEVQTRSATDEEERLTNSMTTTDYAVLASDPFASNLDGGFSAPVVKQNLEELRDTEMGEAYAAESTEPSTVFERSDLNAPTAPHFDNTAHSSDVASLGVNADPTSSDSTEADVYSPKVEPLEMSGEPEEGFTTFAKESLFCATPLKMQVGGNAAQAINQKMVGAIPIVFPSRGVTLMHLTNPNTIAASKLTVTGVMGIIRSSATSSIRMLCTTLGASLHNVDIMDLTEVDFQFLLYWHRLNSYKKLPFTVPWTCNDPEHVKAVKEGRLPASSLKQHTVATKSNIEVRDLDVDKFLQIQKEFQAEYGLKVTLPTVRDMIAVIEQEAKMFDRYKSLLVKAGALNHLRDKKGNIPDEAVDAFLAEDNDPDAVMSLPNFDEVLKLKSDILGEMTSRNYANHYASLLDNSYGSLQDRWKKFSTLPPDALTLLDSLSELADSYGVNESWNVTCSECGASKRVIHRLDALTFLPTV